MSNRPLTLTRRAFQARSPLRLLSASLLVSLCFGFMPPGAGLDSVEAGIVRTPLRLLRITPSGEDVPPGREIVFQFDRPVVPLGRMERDPSEIPITITPPLECQWRWLNTVCLGILGRSLSHDLPDRSQPKRPIRQQPLYSGWDKGSCCRGDE